MAPSRNETPIDVAKTPNPERLKLFDTVGEITARAAVGLSPATGDERRIIGYNVVTKLIGQGLYFANINGELVDLSRFEGEPEPPHTWSR